MAGPSGGAGGGGGDKSLTYMNLKELKRQKTLRSQLQQWRTRRWLSSGYDINLDESQHTPRPVREKIRRGFCCVLLIITVGGLTFIGIILTDVIRLIPCLKPDSTCINVALAEFQNVCDFSSMPVRLTTTASLPPLFSKLQFKSAKIEIGLRDSTQVLATSYFDESGAGAGPMILNGGVQNLTMDMVMTVRYVYKASYCFRSEHREK